VYEVDVDVPPKEEKDKNGKAEDVNENETQNISITVNSYGQQGRGAIQEKILKQRLGVDAINSSATCSETSIRVEMEHTQPGRLRLLSGITASFKPGTLTALMGSSGAGYVCNLCSLLVLENC